MRLEQCGPMNGAYSGDNSSIMKQMLSQLNEQQRISFFRASADSRIKENQKLSAGGTEHVMTFGSTQKNADTIQRNESNTIT